MLVELFQLSRNLRGHGIESGAVHRDFDKPGLTSYVTLKAVLNDGGKIVKLETLLEDEVPGLWTLKKGNFKFFPAIRLPKPPLIIEASDERWQLWKKPCREHVKELLAELHCPIQGIDLSDLRNEQAKRILTWSDEKIEGNERSLIAFAKAFAIFSVSPEAVADEIVRAVNATLDEPVNDGLLQSCLTLLVGSKKEPRNKLPYVEYKVQLCLDFTPEDSPGFTLYSPTIKQLVLACLQKEGGSIEDGNNKICALTGVSMPPLQGPYPDWSAPPAISKPLKPFSKFSEAACNYRYRHADSYGFPIGKRTADVLVGSIKALTEAYKGRVWCAIRNGKTEERNGKKLEARDVLIAYPSFTIEELAVVNVFAKPEVSADDDDLMYAIKSFSDAAEPVCKSFRERVSSESISDYLTLLLIRQISPGQIQLVYSATPSITQFINAVDSWEASSGNLPRNLRIPLPSKKLASGFDWFQPDLLFPEDISRLLSRQWIRDGTECIAIDGPPVGVVLNLFLRKPDVWRQTADQLLELTLVRTSVLLSQAGDRLHRGGYRELAPWKDFYPKTKDGKPDKKKPDPRYQVAQTISLIGSLLHAMNSNVQNYTKETAYLVGKLLAMADELHRCYCIVVRKGDLPNSLIGNGLLGRAAESPASAFEELLERMRIYLGWAKTASVQHGASEDQKIAVNSARKILRLVQPVAERLHQEDVLNCAFGTVEKAHLFLGYLSPVLGSKDEEDKRIGLLSSAATPTS